MTRKQQEAMAYDLALTFTVDTMAATELAEAIIMLCEDFCKEPDYDE